MADFVEPAQRAERASGERDPVSPAPGLDGASRSTPYLAASHAAADRVIRRLTAAGGDADVVRRLPDPTTSPYVATTLPTLVPPTFAVGEMRAAMSDAEIETFVKAIGEPRFTVLAKDKALTADVFVHYKDKAAFLKDFVGANQATVDHIKGVDKIEKGQIKGCHDEDNFRVAIATTKAYKRPDPAGGTVAGPKGKVLPKMEDLVLPIGEIVSSKPIAKPAGVTVLEYKLRKEDNTAELRASSNMKTVIKGLAGQSAKWVDYANEAIWNAIRAKAFDPASASFTGTANDGGKVSGYYNGGAGVDTFFIVE